MLRPLLVFWLIAYSVYYRTRPWNFFQLNSDYFNGEKNIFSKLELNQYIPFRWRLRQVVDDGEIVPEFPVFVKPEWGQNSHGVSSVKTLDELCSIRLKRKWRMGRSMLCSPLTMKSPDMNLKENKSTRSSRVHTCANVTESN